MNEKEHLSLDERMKILEEKIEQLIRIVKEQDNTHLTSTTRIRHLEKWLDIHKESIQKVDPGFRDEK